MMQKYFFAILPDSKLSSEIISFRKKFLNGLNEKDEHKKFPHLTLQHPFSREESFEVKIQIPLNSLARRFQSFEIKLYGVGHFDRRVIFIAVEKNPMLLKLYQDLKNILTTDLKFTDEEVAVEYHPHITLEKKINRADFKLYWKKIQDEKFERTFQCNSFFLMKHSGRVWEELKRYEFNDEMRSR